ncbi:SAM-dependent methyltransferase [Xylanimonas ulmi]|uniref:SAM-dependent methyltransferase n=1 Tax=Xylanimonas ulmi TaxID=228973 RepID=UPI001F5F3ACF|nr:class I SAM-dependent methyltransferase [Xylanibacterium ulmi]
MFTTLVFWDDDHISAQMLAAHLAPDVEAASRTHEVIDRSARWIVEVLGLGHGDRVLDLGCGPGLYACRLAHGGVAVHGVDVSRRSVAHARQVARAEGGSVRSAALAHFRWWLRAVEGGSPGLS